MTLGRYLKAIGRKYPELMPVFRAIEYELVRLNKAVETDEGASLGSHQKRDLDRFRDYPYFTQALGANRTRSVGELFCTWDFTLSAARDVTLPFMFPGAKVTIKNNSGSSHDITLKDYLGNTLATITPGNEQVEDEPS